MEINIQNLDRGLVPVIAKELLEFDTFHSATNFTLWLANREEQTRVLLDLLPEQATPGDHKEAFLAEIYRQTGKHYIRSLIRVLEKKGFEAHAKRTEAKVS